MRNDWIGEALEDIGAGMVEIGKAIGAVMGVFIAVCALSWFASLSPWCSVGIVVILAMLSAWVVGHDARAR